MNKLIDNIEKLHTTELGAVRILKNLNFSNLDVVEWCKQAVRQANHIMESGKNYYAYYNGVVITINAHSYTIITAHIMKPKIRVIKKSDYKDLNEFLYQAIFIPRGTEPPTRSIINKPEIFVYIEKFGSKTGDLGVVAEQNDQVVGAAWTRIISAFGYIDEKTPELAISVLPEFRDSRIGTKLMNKLFQLLKDNGYKQTSLSVQKNNPAVRFYERLGYRIVDVNHDKIEHEDFLMIKYL